MSSTLMPGGTDWRCGRNPSLRATAVVRSWWMSVPPRYTYPALGASTRAKAFSSVDLPHPLGPMSIVSSPSGTSSVMSSITIFRS